MRWSSTTFAEFRGECWISVPLAPPVAQIDSRLVAVRRWQAFTGEHATRLADGRPFADIAARVGLVGQQRPKERANKVTAIAANGKDEVRGPGVARTPATRAPAIAKTAGKNKTAGRRCPLAAFPARVRAAGFAPGPRADDMRGRRPKPTRLKLLTGNPGEHPLNHEEPKPDPQIPDCPVELGPVARREWERLAAELAKLRISPPWIVQHSPPIAALTRSGRKPPRTFRSSAPW